MFSCVWLHFKKCFGKYFLMFGCVLKNTIENTFSTCCSHFLTFSRLSNEYIISFIPQNTNKTQKKIIKSGQTKVRSQSWSKQSTLRAKLQLRSALRAIAIVIDVFVIAITWRSTHRVKIEASIAIAIVIGATAPAGDVGGRWCRSLSLSLSLSLQGRKSFEVKIETENHFRCFGSQIRSTGNAFQFDRIWSNNQTPPFSRKSFPGSVWSQFKRSLSYILNQLEGSQCVTVFLLLEYDRQKKHSILYSYQGSQTHCTSNCTISRNGSKFDFMNGFPQYKLTFFFFPT